MSISRAIARTNAKKEFKSFIKENPQFKAMTFNSFNKLLKEGAKLDFKKKTGSKVEPPLHIHGPDCNHDDETGIDDMMVSVAPADAKPIRGLPMEGIMIDDIQDTTSAQLTQ